MNFKNTILLTGAGFTANFGGFLSKEMWSKIFNNPKLNDAKDIKDELRKSFDFEIVYSSIIDGTVKVHPHSYEMFVESLQEAYSMMDETIKTVSLWEMDLRKLLDYFKEEERGKIGVCFTLNQDLFFERHLRWQPLGPIAMRYKSNSGNIDENDLNSTNPKRLPNYEELESYKKSFSENFALIKLHGSQKWISHDARDAKILGINKLSAIKKIPLLKWYLQLFKEAIMRKNIRLVIIGYSFRDVHINMLMSNAALKYGLKLYVISPENPDEFRRRLLASKRIGLYEVDKIGLAIWNAIDGYFPYKLNEIFIHPQMITAEKSELFRSIGIPLTL